MLQIPSHIEMLSTKTYVHSTGLSCCFRQWRAESHCRFLHGYSLEIRVEFGINELDVRNWGVDFGSLKSFKDWLERTFDHKTLVATDDPMLPKLRDLAAEGVIQLVEVDSTGCEAFALMLFEAAEQWLELNGYSPRCWVDSVEVKEHAGNSAIARIRQGD